MNAIVVWTCVVLLGIGLVALLARMTLGPTVLDRAVAFDVIVSFTVVGVCLHAAVRGSHDTLVLLVVLTLLGFVGSVAIARFIDPDQVDRAATFSDPADLTGHTGHPRQADEEDRS